MCGIAGYLVTNPDRIRAKTLQSIASRLLLEIEQRGRDATGFAYVSLKDKHIYLGKLPVRASEFLKLDGHILTNKKIQKMPRMMVLHTRAATQGLPSNNKNNHPLYSKASGLCMVHNGWITNDDKLIDDYDLSHDAEVDSEIYLRLIEKFYLDGLKENETRVIPSIEKATSLIYGSLACAMIQSGRIDTLWVWKDTGQLTIARTDWGWVFASTKYSLMAALLGESSSFDTPKIVVDEPNNGVLLEIKSNGKVNLGKVKGADWNSLPNIYNNRVYKTTVNGIVTSVRKVRNVATYTNTGSYYNGDYLENYYQPSSSEANQQTYLPSFSKNEKGATNFDSKDQTDSNKSRPPEWLSTYRRQQIQKEVEKTKPHKQCFCRVDYLCFECLGKKQYFGLDLDTLMDAEMSYALN